MATAVVFIENVYRHGVSFAHKAGRNVALKPLLSRRAGLPICLSIAPQAGRAIMFNPKVNGRDKHRALDGQSGFERAASTPDPRPSHNSVAPASAPALPAPPARRPALLNSRIFRPK